MTDYNGCGGGGDYDDDDDDDDINATKQVPV